MTLTLTADEHQLMRELVRDMAYLIARPDHTIETWVSGSRSGATPWSLTEPGSAFDHSLSDRGAISGSWKRRHVVSYFPDPNPPRPELAGKPSRLRFDDEHRFVRITHGRCRKWAASLPPDIRFRAVHCVARDRALSGVNRALTQVAVDALAETPIRYPDPVQLDLFGVEERRHDLPTLFDLDDTSAAS